MKQIKEVIDHIEEPKELEQVVSDAIKSKKKGTKKSKTKWIILEVAAAFFVIFVVGLNANESFAKSFESMNFIGGIAKVLTVRSYEEVKDNQQIKVEVPKVVIVSDNKVEEEEFVKDINVRIEEIVDEYVKDARENMLEYKKAFFETGGTEEEWVGREMDVNVGYEIKFQDQTRLSFVLTGYEGCYAYTEKQVYYNLDLENQKILTLEDLLGEDYIAIANEQIIAQMNERIKTKEEVFWGYGNEVDFAEEGFKTVDENTNFYVGTNGNPVVVFEKYQYSPGYMGSPEFEITVPSLPLQ